ncbi:M56 family metallopeptidase [Tellurirhabdus rosea]|uniref:M56 family metallopeptidase n=1 Tax=Tellurirhabdus rosea TaxID=2674997 RepID=UPI00225635B5|nr:M56 family metallopeptidase [Tellurirhabdus rosea]
MNNLLLLPENLVAALGWALLHSLWQGVLIVALLAVLVRKRRTATRYALGVGALSLQVAAFVLTFVLAYEPPRPAAPLTPYTPLTTAAWLDEAPAALPVNWLVQLESLLPIFVTVWLLGTAVLGLRLAGGWLLVQQWTRQGVQTVPVAWQDHIARLSRELAIDRPVRLLESVRVSVPMTVGWLKPVILIPVGMLTHLSPQQVEAVLAHELAHIRRHDYLINFLQSVAEVVFFYHPAIWYLSSRVREEREHLCDEVAIALTGRPLEYAQTLAAVESLRLAAQPSLALAFGGTKSQLLERVRRVLGVAEEPSSRGMTGFLLVAGLVLIAGLAVARQVQQPEEMPTVETTIEELLVEEPDTLLPEAKSPATTSPRVVGTPLDAKQLQLLEEEVRRKEEKMEAISREIERLSEPLESLSEKLGQEGAALERVGQKLDAPGRKLEALGNQFETLAARMAEDSARLPKVRSAEQKALKARIAGQKAELARLQTQMETVIEKQMQPLLKELNVLQQAKLAGVQDSMRQYTDQIARLATEQRLHAAEFERAHRELERAQRALELARPEDVPDPVLAPAAPAAPRAPRRATTPRAPKPAGVKGEYWYNGKRYDSPDDFPRPAPVARPPKAARPALPAPASAPNPAITAEPAEAIEPARPARPPRAPKPADATTPSAPANPPKPPKLDEDEAVWLEAVDKKHKAEVVVIVDSVQTQNGRWTLHKRYHYVKK